MLVLMFLMVSTPLSGDASAGGRRLGASWSYRFSAEAPPVFGTGLVTCEFLGEDTLLVGGAQHEVDVFGLRGELAGNSTAPGSFAEEAFAGFVCVSRERWSVVTACIHTWTNVTVGPPSFALIARSEQEIVISFTPPLLSGFDPGSTNRGDSWHETIAVERRVTEWSNGSLVRGPDTEARIMDIQAHVRDAAFEIPDYLGRSIELIELEIVVDDSALSRFWWSDEMDCFVLINLNEEGQAMPKVNATLVAYDVGRELSTWPAIAAGIGVFAAAVIVLVAVLVRGRKPRTPRASRPEGSPPRASERLY